MDSMKILQQTDINPGPEIGDFGLYHAFLKWVAKCFSHRLQVLVMNFSKLVLMGSNGTQ